MSEADKLFEELGYKKNEGNFYLEYIHFRNDAVEVISFDKIHNSFYKHYNHEVSFITMQELKAINMKCKELRMGVLTNGIIRSKRNIKR